ncbi:MAG: hypothetical protein AAF390_06515 [Pseudomonadota bacterium]
MSPEATILVVNGAFLALAYLWVYPAVGTQRLGTLLRYDLAISGAAVLTAGLLYAGRGERFDLLVADGPWWLFSILSFLAMEVPAAFWLLRGRTTGNGR